MTTQKEILQFLHYSPSSSRVEIANALSEAPNERTLKRIIADSVQKGEILVEGRGRATRYSCLLYTSCDTSIECDLWHLYVGEVGLIGVNGDGVITCVDVGMRSHILVKRSICLLYTSRCV